MYINMQLNHQEVRFDGLFSACKNTCVTMQKKKKKMAEILYELFGSLHRGRYSDKIRSPGGRDVLRLPMFICLITWFQLQFQNNSL